MKKLLVICLSIIMVATMSITAFAAPGGFISSPSGKSAPELVEYSNEDENCTAKLKITAYSERDSLSDSLRETFEAAYNSIANTSDLTQLNSELSDIADKLNTSADNFAVSDFFDLNYSDCDLHEEHGKFTIKLKADVLDNFVALMYFNGEEWVIVESAEVSSDNVYLTFASQDLGPFAIVVDTSTNGSVTGSTENPQTGDSFPWIYVVFMGVSVLGLAVITIVYFKKKNA